MEIKLDDKELFATSITIDGVRYCGYCGSILPLGDSPCTCPDWGKSLQQIKVERLRAERMKAAERAPRNFLVGFLALLVKIIDRLTAAINWLNHLLKIG